MNACGARSFATLPYKDLYPTMSSFDEPESVDPALRRADAKAARHLEEACEEVGQKDLSQESLDELMRLEIELLAAARAVDETVRLRRQLGEQPASVQPSRTTPAPSPQPAQPADEPPGCRLRDFTDAGGKEWRVWEVRPGSHGRPSSPERYLGEYVKGWLAFECPGDEMRKRLPNHPADWFRMADSELDQLLPRAIDVPKRKPKPPDVATD
jgi:hypothetical protein